MKLKNKYLNILNSFISGIGIILLGIITIIGSISMYKKIINIFVIIFLVFGLSRLVKFILNKKIVRNKQVLISIIINILFGLIMFIFPKISLAFLPILFSLYLLFNCLIKFISYLNLKENNYIIRFKELFLCIIFFILSLMFLFYPINRLSFFISIIGIYCLLLGINLIFEFIIDILSDRYKLKIKKILKINLPLFLEAFIPKNASKKINKYLDYLLTEEKQNKSASDLQIFIHLSNYGFNQFGHMDILFNGKIYSYGNYDKDSYKLFDAIGDGVIFSLTKKMHYIKFCIKNSRKTIVEYGIKLTLEEIEKINIELNNILKNTYEWYPKCIRENKKEHKDYASKLYKATNAKFYKLNGEFKTYFVLGHNCTFFANKLLRNGDIQVLKFISALTPGAYFEYLEENYKKKNSKIVSRKIYSKKILGDKYDKNKKQF